MPAKFSIELTYGELLSKELNLEVESAYLKVRSPTLIDDIPELIECSISSEDKKLSTTDMKYLVKVRG